MVQYVITPWRDRAELLRVKYQFSYDYRASTTLQSSSVVRTDEEKKRKRNDRHAAVARVAMWMQRGNCPHLVESTALLTAAVLSDEEANEENAASSSYALRAAYAAAFSRYATKCPFVTSSQLTCDQFCDWFAGRASGQAAKAEHVCCG
jgi:hypothetical protein